MTEEQILAQEMAKLANAQNGYGEQKMLDETEVYKALSAPFPEDAYMKDSSRGFDLTSVKAQYIVERLNESLGVMNWTFGGEFKETENGVLYMGALVITINGKQNRQFAPGYAANKKNLGDTYKSAHTDSLSKCSSKFGIANDVFKGLVTPPGAKTTTARAAKLSTTKSISTPKKVLGKSAATPKKVEATTEKVVKTPSSFKTRRSRPSLKVSK